MIGKKLMIYIGKKSPNLVETKEENWKIKNL